jgi:hypothetical protein
MGWTTVNHYYSGQGTVLLADRDALGKPKGYIPVGNVSALTLAVATSVIDHKESESGQRSVDKRLITETKVTMTMTLENFIAANLATALRGKAVTTVGATVTAEALTLYPGQISALSRIKISAVTVKQGATSLVAYVDDLTPYDYKVNAETGSIQLNSGSPVLPSAAGTVVTTITVGATTSFAVANTAAVGDSVFFYGFTGADAALVNGKTFVLITGTNATTLVIALVSTSKVITASAASKVLLPTISTLVDYSYADQVQIDALMTGQKEVYMRFEGLNTAEDNQPVVVEVFKFAADPLKEMSLISDTIQQFQLEGPALRDNLRTSGSFYFKTTKIA